MKPILLKMKCFGSYRDETIDFSGIDHGIFLITGDTGAGKTTIFDAITYALFDSSSGAKRSAQMMVSQYARPNERTSVEFTFKIGEDIYKVVRSPEQKKYKEVRLEGGETVYEEKSTVEKSSVELTLSDGTVFTGKKRETDQKIKDIIGMDCQQFTQIAMLSQGDFLKLLHAESKVRKEIFSKIFDTRIYYEIEQEIEERYKNAYGLLEDNKKEIINRIADVVCPEYLEMYPLWQEKGVFGEDNDGEILEALGGIIDELDECNERLEQKHRELSEQKTELDKKINDARVINSEFDRLEAALCEKEALLKRQGEYDEKLKSANNAKRALAAEGKYKEYRLINDSRIRAQKLLQALLADLEELSERLLLARKNWETAGAEYDENIELRTKKAAYTESRLGLYDDVESLQKEYDICVENLKKLRAKEKEADLCGEAIEKSEREAEREREELKEARERYDKLYNAFISNQAHILRQTLREGAPCPVCGSVHHVFTGDDDTPEVSRQDMELAKKLAEDKEKALLKKEKKIEELRRNHIELKAFTDAKRSEYSTLADEKKQQLEDKKGELEFETRLQAEDNVRKLKEEIHLLSEQRKKALEDYQSRENEYNILLGKKDAQNESCRRLMEDEKEALSEFEAALLEKGFGNMREFLASRLDEGVLSKLEEDIQDYRKRVERNEYDIENFSERTKDKERIDITQMAQSREKTDVQLNEVSGEIKKCYSMLERNAASKAFIEEKFRIRKRLSRDYVLLKDLYDTARGKLSGKKINFQTYIQRYYFRQVINAANSRLLKMSGSQFLLRCREIENLSSQGEAGLDLDVYSIVNDSIRDVKTLSGGESFQAALSMALGLSDIMHNTAGRIRVDTMFIDEGFGSLSDESRNKALQLLGELSDGTRLIGIISHVTELKAQVETKLVITKDGSGSRAEWKL